MLLGPGPPFAAFFSQIGIPTGSSVFPCVWSSSSNSPPRREGMFWRPAPERRSFDTVSDAQAPRRETLRKAQLLAICSGDRENLRELMEEFVRCTIRAREDLHRPQTLEELKKTAHRLRGSFSYLVEGGGVERIDDLERACLTKHDALVPSLLRSVTEDMEALERQLREELGGQDQPPADTAAS